jgi:signal transduction histidine kinase
LRVRTAASDDSGMDADRFSGSGTWTVGGLALVSAAIGAVLLLTEVTLHPPASDLAALATFLALSGGSTVALGLGFRKFQFPVWLRSLRTRLLLASVLTATLALINVGFTSFLMFISGHDLALLAGLLGFSLGVSVFVAAAITEPAVRSLRDLGAAVAKISAGDLKTRVPVESEDEIGELAVSINTMAAKLEASLEKERELTQSRRELVSAVSHDLRTPLASIRAMVESMVDGVVDDEETTGRYLRNTLSEVEYLSQLVDDLFEIARMDAGMLQLHVEDASVQDLISDTLESMSAQAAAREVSLQGGVHGEIAPLVMDTRRVQRVVYNLVQNSIRHTPPDGTIDISARDAGDEVQLVVSDTGDGVREQDRERLFDRSYRADPSRSRSSGGAGLGLSIAKGIVEAHGGRIWFESIVGQGSKFSFTIPKRLPE